MSVINGEVKKHPSYGMLSISKFSGGSGEFFGSEMKHSGGVTLTISEGSVERGLNHDWFRSESKIVQIRMTHSQFIDAITSGMNTIGVPCTLEIANGEHVEQIGHAADKVEKFRTEMRKMHGDILDSIDTIFEEHVGKMGKRKAEEFARDMSNLKMHITSNIPYVAECFDEEMEKTVIEAKQSIEGYIQGKINTLGIEAIKGGITQIK